MLGVSPTGQRVIAVLHPTLLNRIIRLGGCRRTFMVSSGERAVRKTKDRHSAPGTKGRVLHSAAGYDLLAWLLLLGRERAFRERLVRLARLKPGQSVLDIGCGTGSLAIAAKRCVGPSGTVQGIDASPEMITRARKKASKIGVAVTFTNGIVETLPFPDGQVDAVLSTLMLHHLPREARRQCAREMRRVLRPGGHVLAVDFGGTTGGRKSLVEHFHRHGRVDPRDIIELLSDAGFEIVESGAVGVRDLNFVLGTA
jgi:ubiquinone/menaquinone biosynthesis C-methylase UbiE